MMGIQKSQNSHNKETKTPRVVMVSGGFDPVHVGHLALFQDAKKLGDKLIVVLNSDQWLLRKKGKVFMKQDDRARIIRAVSYTHLTLPTILRV